jgi:hypothetical protein
VEVGSREVFKLRSRKRELLDGQILRFLLRRPRIDFRLARHSRRRRRRRNWAYDLTILLVQERTHLSLNTI